MDRSLLEALPDLVGDEPAISSVLGSRSASLVVPESAQAILLAALVRRSGRRPLLVVVPTSSEAEQLAGDLGSYLGENEVELFSAWQTLPFERVSPGIETMGQRMRVLHRLVNVTDPPSVVVASGRALAQRLVPSARQVSPLVIGSGDTVDQTALVKSLVAVGYRREYQVEHRGELAVRGSIVDVWPSTSEAPFRIDFWGDEVDRLFEFGVADQRTIMARAEIEVFPSREMIPDPAMRARATALISEQPWGRTHWERLAAGELFDGMESWLPWLDNDEWAPVELLNGDALVVVVEPRRVRDRVSDLEAEERELAGSLAATWGADGSTFPRLHRNLGWLFEQKDVPLWTIDPVAVGPGDNKIVASEWGANWRRPAVDETPRGVVTRLAGLLAEGFRVVVTADGDGSASRLSRLLAEDGLVLAEGTSATDPGAPGAHIVVAPLNRGFLLPDSKLAVVTEVELTGRRRTRRGSRPRRRASIRIFEDLTAGDYVVHEHHGIARFAGLVTRTLTGVERDYLLLEYRGDDRLYLPTDQIDTIRPYTGGERPTLSRMGGADWERTKSRVRSAAAEIAEELVSLYRRRISTPGRAFGEDTPWQREMEQSFPYQETVDQLTAVEDVKADMERPTPMDRIVCGDVGFGKTEVAIRAVFKAVQDGCQAAILVPTTLLAQQHGETFRERFAPYPIRVEVLSRFLTARETRRVVEGLADGSVDVVIGTHRLISDDVAFARLGLLVIDEEHRFGVTHKESIKVMQADLDVLTLTATPIPRTLEMSLTGIRDLSLINTPPADRQPILTFVGEYDERAVVEAIRRELLREGQVFFVHNRVHDIDQVAGGLKDLVPEARIGVAHGQMDEAQLETVVIDFWDGRYDVLVCTTIIESGIDIPTVNTLVVNRSDLLGLGQLHQLRGRVGRAGQRAYAYLFTPSDRALTEQAYERLRTIGETTELGSGFRLAMRDLEIRGAGNLLGLGQTGHIAAVGYDLYCQMVTEAVVELSGELPEVPADIRVEIPVDAHLPDDYVGRSDLRLEAYRKLAAAGSTADPANVELVQAEWEDRYGPLPTPVISLLNVARLRTVCVARGITEVVVTPRPGVALGSKSGFLARCAPVELPLSRQARLARLHPEGALKNDSGQLHLPLDGDNLVTELTGFLEDLVPVLESVP